MEVELVLAVATLALGLVSTFAGAKWTAAKGKAKLTVQLLSDVIDAAEDDAITEPEFQKIVASVKKVQA